MHLLPGHLLASLQTSYPANGASVRRAAANPEWWSDSMMPAHAGEYGAGEVLYRAGINRRRRGWAGCAWAERAGAAAGRCCSRATATSGDWPVQAVDWQRANA
jgi:hypothetical protein